MGLKDMEKEVYEKDVAAIPDGTMDISAMRGEVVAQAEGSLDLDRLLGLGALVEKGDSGDGGQIQNSLVTGMPSPDLGRPEVRQFDHTLSASDKREVARLEQHYQSAFHELSASAVSRGDHLSTLLQFEEDHVSWGAMYPAVNKLESRTEKPLGIHAMLTFYPPSFIENAPDGPDVRIEKYGSAWVGLMRPVESSSAFAGMEYGHMLHGLYAHTSGRYESHTLSTYMEGYLVQLTLALAATNRGLEKVFQEFIRQVKPRNIRHLFQEAKKWEKRFHAVFDEPALSEGEAHSRLSFFQRSALYYWAESQYSYHPKVLERFGMYLQEFMGEVNRQDNL